MLNIANRHWRGYGRILAFIALAGAAMLNAGCGRSASLTASQKTQAKSNAPPATNADVSPATQQKMAQQEQMQQQQAQVTGQAKAAAEAHERPPAAAH